MRAPKKNDAPRTPLGSLQRPQTPSWKRLGYTPIRPIGVNRPAFGGAVPHFHQMSRGPAKSADVPHFSKMVLLFFPLPIRPYSTCLPRNATK